MGDTPKLFQKLCTASVREESRTGTLTGGVFCCARNSAHPSQRSVKHRGWQALTVFGPAARSPCLFCQPVVTGNAQEQPREECS